MVLLLSLLPPGTSLNSHWWKKGWKEGQQTQGQRKYMSSEIIA